MTKIALLLGGSGFIGGALIGELIKSSDFVNLVVLSRRGAPHPPQHNCRIVNIIMDFDELDSISGLVKSVDVVFNLINSNLVLNDENNEFDADFYRGSQTYKLYQACAHHDIPLIIFSSGGAIYGNHGNTPLAETHALNPVSQYGCSKKAAELLAKYFSRHYGLRYKSLRIANAYGPGQLPNKGQGLISTVFYSLLRGNKIKKFGNQLLVRDYIFIEDVVSAIISVYKSGQYSQSYNIGTGVGTSFKELMHCIQSISKLQVGIEIVDSRLEDVDSNVLDISKIKKDTGWAPRISIDDGLKLSFEWMKAFNYYEK